MNSTNRSKKLRFSPGVREGWGSDTGVSEIAEEGEYPIDLSAAPSTMAQGLIPATILTGFGFGRAAAPRFTSAART
jgi:hypothetical protein